MSQQVHSLIKNKFMNIVKIYFLTKWNNIITEPITSRFTNWFFRLEEKKYVFQVTNGINYYFKSSFINFWKKKSRPVLMQSLFHI